MNRGGYASFRRLDASNGYLGDLPEKNRMHVVTEIDPVSGVLLARNPYSNDFPGRIAFFDVDDTARSVTADRAEFIGRNGGFMNPAGMASEKLSGRTGPALDPCGAIRVPFELLDGQTREIVFRLGAGFIPRMPSSLCSASAEQR